MVTVLDVSHFTWQWGHSTCASGRFVGMGQPCVGGIRCRSHYGGNDGDGSSDGTCSRSHYEELSVTVTVSLP